MRDVQETADELVVIQSRIPDLTRVPIPQLRAVVEEIQGTALGEAVEGALRKIGNETGLITAGFDSHIMQIAEATEAEGELAVASRPVGALAK